LDGCDQLDLLDGCVQLDNVDGCDQLDHLDGCGQLDHLDGCDQLDLWMDVANWIIWMHVTTSHLDQIQRVKKVKKTSCFFLTLHDLNPSCREGKLEHPGNRIGNFALAEPAHTYSGTYHGKK
jgi:hypothetical protein